MELKKYATLLWRWTWLIALGAILVGGSAGLISMQTAPVYRAISTLMVSQSRPANSIDYSTMLASEQLAKTYGELLKNPTLLRQVTTQLGMTPAVARHIAVEVQPIRDTQLILLAVDGPDPATAVLIAEELPALFAEQSAQIQSSRYASSKQALQQEMKAVQDDITEAQKSLAALPSDPAAPERSRQEANLAQYRATYADLLKSYETIRVAEAQEAGILVVVSPPEMPTSPVAPRPLLNATIGLLVGLMLAIGLALLIEYLDDRVRRPEDVEATKLPTLGTIGIIYGKGTGDKLIVTRAPQSGVSEAYRVLRTNLKYATLGNKPLRRLLVTSSNAGEGKSITAANLATSLAEAGSKVIIIDCDLRRPSQHSVFGLSNGQGLTTALVNAGTRPALEYVQESGTPGLLVMPSGPLPPNPAELLNSGAMQQVLADLDASADIIVLDSPPVMGMADAAILGRLTDGILLVVQWGATRRDALTRARQALAPIGTPLLGLVLNRVKPRSNSAYYQYSYYSRSAASRKKTGLTGRLAGWLQMVLP